MGEKHTLGNRNDTHVGPRLKKGSPVGGSFPIDPGSFRVLRVMRERENGTLTRGLYVLAKRHKLVAAAARYLAARRGHAQASGACRVELVRIACIS